VWRHWTEVIRLKTAEIEIRDETRHTRRFSKPSHLSATTLTLSRFPYNDGELEPPPPRNPSPNPSISVQNSNQRIQEVSPQLLGNRTVSVSSAAFHLS
jgi:hypothetical protein